MYHKYKMHHAGVSFWEKTFSVSILSETPSTYRITETQHYKNCGKNLSPQYKSSIISSLFGVIYGGSFDCFNCSL